MKMLHVIKRYRLSNDSIINYAKSTAGREGMYIGLKEISDKYSVQMGALLTAIKRNETLSQAVYLMAAAGKEGKEPVIELRMLPKLLAALVFNHHPAIASTDVKEWIDEIHSIEIKNGRVMKTNQKSSFDHLQAGKQGG